MRRSLTHRRLELRTFRRRTCPRVEAMEGRTLLATITVTGTGDTIAADGVVTLREAITSTNNGAPVNADVVPTGSFGTNDRIEFHIPGAGVHSIQPTTSLPDIHAPVTIDGYTQPGSSPNTNGPGLADNAVLLIELDGSSAGGDGLTVSHDSTVQGLVINRFSAAGITMSGSSRNVIQGNWIGTNATGTATLANGTGVFIDDADSNTVGGTTPAARNVISGNRGSGVVINASTHTLVEGNFLGTDVSGASALQNVDGVELRAGAALNTIGGMTAAARNVISGNRGIGIDFTGSTTTGNLVQGNWIGTDAAGAAALGNGQGIEIDNSAGNTIGGAVTAAGNVVSGNRADGIILSRAVRTLVQSNLIGISQSGAPLGNADAGVDLDFAQNATVEGNVIAFNGTSQGNRGIAGVVVFANPNSTDVTGNRISQNSLFSNVGLGIDLGDDGVTTNHPGGAGSGPNLFQNVPIILSATAAGSGTAVAGSLNSKPNTAFHLEFFVSAAADTSGFGEGQTFLGSLDNVTTDGNGNANFAAAVAALPAGQTEVTATATDPNGNTSEFSQAVVATTPGQADLAISSARVAPSSVAVGGAVTYTIHAVNNGPATADHVTIVDTLPTGITFVSADADQGHTVSQGGNVVTITLSFLDPGDTVTATFVGTANAAGTRTATVRLSADEPDPDAANNTAALTVTVPTPASPTADLAVTQHGAPNPVKAGHDLIYTITVRNGGPALATRISLACPPLPANVRFVSTTAGHFDAAGNRVVASLGTLPVGATRTVTIKVRPTAAAAGARLVNTVKATAAETDPDPANNVAVTTTPVISAPATGPTVLSLARFGFHAQPTILVLRFDQPLDPLSAQDPSNYTIVTLGRPGRGGSLAGHRIGVVSAVYNASARSVTLSPAERLDVHHAYRLMVNGTTPGGVRGASGLRLDGAGTGLPGSDFVGTIDFQTLAGPASAASTTPGLAASGLAIERSRGMMPWWWARLFGKTAPAQEL